MGKIPPLLFWVMLLVFSTSFVHGQPVARQRGVTDVATDSKSSVSIGPYYALVIGNNDYTYLGKLRTAVSDATAMAQLLQDRYGFKTTLLKNARREDILSALAEYRRTLTANANLVVYYAGHGYEDKEASEAYWLPVNAQSNNNQNWISADDITRDVRAIAALHVLIISDSCYSGDLTRAAFNINLGDHAAFLTKMLKSKSRTLMASGGDEPVADNGAGGHSVFAGAILQTLQHMDEPQFTAASLFQKVQEQVGGRSAQMPQYDVLRNSGHEFGDFVFSRGGSTAIAGRTVAPGSIPVDLNTDIEAISEAVQRYQDAYNQLNAGALWEVWPTVPAKTRHTIEAAFASAASIQMNIEPGTPDIAADHEDAVVKGQFTQTFTPKNGKAQPERRGNIVFVLKKNNGKWTIVDVPN